MCDLPVRAAKFVPRKNWVVTGSDDMQVNFTLFINENLDFNLIIIIQVRVFNYNTLDRVTSFEAHSDYVRCIAVHPTQPFMLTSSGKFIKQGNFFNISNWTIIVSLFR